MPRLLLSTRNQLARGQRLREILKQPASSPISVEEQVAVIYTGINGFLDDIPVNKVSAFVTQLRSNLKNSKPQYGEIVRDTKAFTPEAEAMVKETIAALKQSFA